MQVSREPQVEVSINLHTNLGSSLRYSSARKSQGLSQVSGRSVSMLATQCEGRHNSEGFGLTTQVREPRVCRLSFVCIRPLMIRKCGNGCVSRSLEARKVDPDREAVALLRWSSRKETEGSNPSISAEKVLIKGVFLDPRMRSCHVE